MNVREAAYMPKAYRTHRAFRQSKNMNTGGRKRGLSPWEIALMAGLICIVIGIIVWSVVKKKMRPSPPLLDSPSQASTLSHNPSQTTPPTQPQTQETKYTIFVSIASYRDPEVCSTLLTLFHQADDPTRVTVGICQQNEASDLDTIDGYSDLCENHGIGRRYFDSIRILRWPAEDAEGPCKARAAIEEKCFGGETFYLQVDSHTKFEKGWDRILIEEWTEAYRLMGHTKIILTAYPAPYSRSPLEVFTKDAPTHPSFLFPDSFDKATELPTFASRPSALQPSRSYLQLGFAGCFAFSLSQRMEVPYLSKVPFLFFGEEYAMGGLYFTYGWDMVMPTRVPLRTLYDRSYRHTFWELYSQSDGERRERADLKEKAVERVFRLIEGKVPAHPVGSVRTFRAWEDYLGLSMIDKTIQEMAKAGISPEASQHEIICKYGSVSALKEASSKEGPTV